MSKQVYLLCTDGWRGARDVIAVCDNLDSVMKLLNDGLSSPNTGLDIQGRLFVEVYNIDNDYRITDSQIYRGDSIDPEDWIHLVWDYKVNKYVDRELLEEYR